MWVLIGETNFLKDRLQVDDLASIYPWQVVSAEKPLPEASVYLDLSGCFARHRPANIPENAWWIVHAPHFTLNELPPRSIRLNAWPGFASGQDWEMVWEGKEAEAMVRQVCDSLKKNPIRVPDQIGFIGARVLASIINEGFLLKQEGAATEADIDQAMKLGTNYPRGPFEWCERIGKEEVHFLLKRLAEIDPRYTPAAGFDKPV